MKTRDFRPVLLFSILALCCLLGGCAHTRDRPYTDDDFAWAIFELDLAIKAQDPQVPAGRYVYNSVTQELEFQEKWPEDSEYGSEVFGVCRDVGAGASKPKQPPWPKPILEGRMAELRALRERNISEKPDLYVAQIVYRKMDSEEQPVFFLDYLEADNDDVGIIIEEVNKKSGKRIVERYPILGDPPRVKYYGLSEDKLPPPPPRRTPYFWITFRQREEDVVDPEAWENFWRLFVKLERNKRLSLEEYSKALDEAMPPFYMSEPGNDIEVFARIYDAAGNISNPVEVFNWRLVETGNNEPDSVNRR